MNAGQICVRVDRVIVELSVAEEFTARFAARVSQLPYGVPIDPGDAIGPFVDARAADRVTSLVGDALAKGATMLAGTGKPEGPDTLLRPVVLSGVTDRMRIHQQEIFGQPPSSMPSTAFTTP
ncbi:hypothetical protein GCM10023084_37410 [Streptomyces lacrimifluminis]|uniref:Aldehyde dehydrogenase domain-containing protein n=1 Tax=Streptomyces lacrimifluminis TaxID=1500077 RepID=A0A917NY88_9ACTN|nr:hypothetical protein GCM10012282_36540 [Streptomyces lacrimifluminis]